MEDVELAELLKQAIPKPAFLAITDGGPVLSLALHCLMIQAGFELASNAAHGRTTPTFVPPKDWNGMYLDQWIFEYVRSGKANKFTLHCSLQAKSKRMFVHASEDSNQANVCVLGLQLENYVPDPSILKSNNWAGAVTNTLKLHDLFTEYITQPLAQNAQEAQAPPEGQQNGAHDGEGAHPGQGGGWWGRQGQGQVVLVLGAVAVVAVGVVVAYRMGAGRRRG